MIFKIIVVLLLIGIYCELHELNDEHITYKWQLFEELNKIRKTIHLTRVKEEAIDKILDILKNKKAGRPKKEGK